MSAIETVDKEMKKFAPNETLICSTAICFFVELVDLFGAKWNVNF